LCAFVGVAANEPAAQTDERSPEGLCSGDVDASTTPEAARCSTIGGSLVVTGHLHPAFTDAAALDDFDDRLASLGASSDASADEKRNTAPNALLRVEGDVVVAPGAAETSLRGAFPRADARRRVRDFGKHQLGDPRGVPEPGVRGRRRARRR
jgi:hypothetical protein